MTMLAYNLMSLFRQAVMKSPIHHTLGMLRHKVFASAAWWDKTSNTNKLYLAISHKRRRWFEGLWTASSNPSSLGRSSP